MSDSSNQIESWQFENLLRNNHKFKSGVLFETGLAKNRGAGQCSAWNLV